MSNRRLRTIAIAATVRHEARGLTARAHRHKRSAPRVAAHRRRMRDGRAVFRVELSVPELLVALEAAGHLEGADRHDDHFVRDALQIFLEDWIAHGPRR
jgi:hypothetical protein